MTLLKLPLLCEKPEYEEIAVKMFEHFGFQIEEYSDNLIAALRQ